MRTLVFALAGASVAASGVAYSLQATRSPISEALLSSPSSTSSTVAAEAMTVGTVRSVSILEPDPPQETLQAAVLAPSGASRTDYYEVEQASSAKPEATTNDGAAAEIASKPPAPFAVAARAEQPGDDTSSDQPAAPPGSTKQKPAKTTAKKPVSPDSVNKEKHHAKIGAAPKTKDQTLASKPEPAPDAVPAVSSPSAELPNPISKLRELFGAQ